MRRMICMALAFLLILPSTIFFVACNKTKNEIIGIEVESKENSKYKIEEERIEITYNNENNYISEENFIVKVVYRNNGTKIIKRKSEREDGYEYETTINESGVTEAGEYIIKFKYKSVEEKEIKVIVNKAEIKYEDPELTFKKIKYDGNEHKPVLTNLPNGVKAKYIYKQNGEEKETPKEVGEYTVSIELTCDNNHKIISPNLTNIPFTIEADNDENLPGENPENKIEFSKKELEAKFENLEVEEISLENARKILLTIKPNNEVEDLLKSAEIIYNGKAKYSGIDYEIEYKIENKFSGDIENNFKKEDHKIKEEKIGENVVDAFTIKLTNDEKYNNFELKVLIIYAIEEISYIESVNVESYNYENESKNNKKINNEFEGTNEIITKITANIKEEYKHCEAKYYANKELKEIYDVKNLNKNKVYVAIYNNNKLIEVKTIKIKYNFVDYYNHGVNNYIENYVLEIEEEYFMFDTNAKVGIENLSNLEDPSDLNFIEGLVDETNHLIINIKITIEIEYENQNYSFTTNFIVRSSL